MKHPPTSLQLLVLGAVASLFMLAACQTTPFGAYPLRLLELASGKHIKIAVSKKQFARALQQHAADYDTEYCAKSGTEIACEQINPKTIGTVLGSIRTASVTKSAQAETGAGDELQPDAIHVAQRATFKSAKQMEAFLSAIDGK